MFKSCYPISDVGSDGSPPGDPFSSVRRSLANYKAVYRNAAGSGTTYTNGGYSYLPLEDIFAANPDTLFIPVTAPPLDLHAARATPMRTAPGCSTTGSRTIGSAATTRPIRGWTTWPCSTGSTCWRIPDDDPSHPNRLKEAYGGTGGDAHPNSAANVYSTQVFATNSVNFIDEAYRLWSTLPGDFNRDGAVDPLDLDVWKSHAGVMSGATFSMGDANADGVVNLLDLDVWKANVGRSRAGSGSLAGPSAAGVPEPGTLAMLAAGLLGLLAWRFGIVRNPESWEYVMSENQF